MLYALVSSYLETNNLDKANYYIDLYISNLKIKKEVVLNPKDLDYYFITKFTILKNKNQNLKAYKILKDYHFFGGCNIQIIKIQSDIENLLFQKYRKINSNLNIVFAAYVACKWIFQALTDTHLNGWLTFAVVAAYLLWFCLNSISKELSKKVFDVLLRKMIWF